MADSADTKRDGALSVLFETERRLAERLQGVIRFDARIYRELQADVHAIPQAIAVVLATAALAGLGRGSIVLLFLWIALAILQWLAITGLIWAVGHLAVEKMPEYSRLLRCTGFAYAWFSLLVGASVPIIGPLFAWAGVIFSFASLVVATREVLAVDTLRALGICAVALGVPMTLLFSLGG